MKNKNMYDRKHDYFQRNARVIFDTLDLDKNGFITKAELTTYFKKMKMPYSSRLVDAIFKESDSSNDYRLTFSEFQAFAAHQDEKLYKLFKTYDEDEKGYLTSFEFTKLIRKVNPSISQKSINTLIEKLDQQKDSLITFQEFIHFYFMIPISDISMTFDFFDFGYTESDEGLWNVFDRFTSGERTPLLMQTSGAIGGIISKTLTAPLERIKLYAQNSHSNTYILETAKKMIKEDGYSGFFRGNLTNIIKSIPELMIRMYIFNQIRLKWSVEPDFPSVQERLQAGFIAGGISNISVYPLEIIRTRLALAKTNTYNGITDCFFKLYKEKGILGLYRGGLTSIIFAGIMASSELSAFLSLRDWHVRKFEYYPSVVTLIGMGAIASLVGQTISFPFSVIRTRLQNQSHLSPQYAGISDALMKTVQIDHFKGLYKGLTATYLKSLPSITVNWITFYIMRSYLNKQGIVVE